MPSSGGQTCARSEEHTSELQSHDNLVCRLLLEKKQHDPCQPLMRLFLRRAGGRPHGGRRRAGGCARQGGRGGWRRRGEGGDIAFFFFKSWGTPRGLPLSPTHRPSI